MKFYFFSSLLVILMSSSAKADGDKFSGKTAGDTDLLHAVELDDVPAIRELVANDPSQLETSSGGGQTPLIRAVLKGKLDSVKALLELNADTSATERQGYNVLHAAGFQGRNEILEVLLKHFEKQKEIGGHVLDPKTDKHSDGFYPLHRACWGREARHADTLKVFLDAGVPYDIVSDNGLTCEGMTKNPDTLAVIAKMKGGDEL